jgi:hypothetical protein
VAYGQSAGINLCQHTRCTDAGASGGRRTNFCEDRRSGPHAVPRVGSPAQPKAKGRALFSIAHAGGALLI